MNMWKDVLTRLAETGKIIAQWQLASGVTFYMYIPAASAMGESTIKPESDVGFDEIVHLDILRSVPLGGLTATNDVEACQRTLTSVRGVLITEVPGGLRVSLEKPALP